MKRLSLKFFAFFVSTLLVSLPIFQLYSPPTASALVSSGFWTKRTPKTASGAFATANEFDRMGHWNTYYSAHTPFAELIESKPASEGGGRVIHWFLGIPSFGEWGSTLGRNSIIFHSSDQGANWNRITPDGMYGSQMDFVVVPEPWHSNNDPTQSRWNGKLLVYTNKIDNRVDIYFGSYWGYRPALYRYDGNGFTSNWTNLINENLPGFNDRYMIGSSYYGMYGVYGKAFQSGITMFKGKVYLVSWRVTQVGWPCRWELIVQAYDGTMNQLVNAPAGLVWTHKWTGADQYENYPYMGPNYVLFFEKIDDYLFLGTGQFTNAMPYSLQQSPGILYQSDANGENFAHNLPAPMTGRVLSDLSPLGAQNRANLTFTLQIGGVNYTAYARAHAGFYPGTGDTQFVHFSQNYWGYYMYYNWDWIAPGYGDYLWRGYWMGQWTGSGGVCAFEYSSINHTTREVWVSMIMPAASTAPQPIIVPMTMIEYKGYAYAGFSHNSGNVSGVYATGKLRRTNRFTDNVGNHNTFVDAVGDPQGGGFANWEDCGDVLDPAYPQWDRRLRDKNAAVTKLQKSRKPATGGGFEDDLLYIGSSSQGWYSGAGVNAMYTTEGLNAGGVDATPLSYTLYEDEWNYDRNNPSLHYNGVSPNQMYSVYDIKNSAVGLLVFFSTIRDRGAEGYGTRYFHILNAAPSLRIDHNPKPFVIERGQNADVTFELSPSGGFGQAGFRMQLIFESPNIYLPSTDPLGNPYTENQRFSTRLSQPGPLQFFTTMPLEITATVRTTLSQPLGMFDVTLIVTDELLGMTVPYTFRITVRPPQPGFTASVIPGNRRFHAGETVCFDVNIETRFDFEDNVIIGIFWSNPPPTNDTEFEWKDSTYIFNRMDQTMVEVFTRKNMGTQYEFCLHTEKSVTPGNYEFQLMFFSSVETRVVTVRIQVLPPQPTFQIDTMPYIGKTVPGGVVHYQIVVQSLDNYVGPVTLHLENIPSTVQVVSLQPVTVNLSLAQPVAYAELVLQTFSAIFAPDRPTNFFSRVISSSVVNLSWTSSRKGTHDIAGYEIYRGPNNLIERAVKIAEVGPNIVNYDDAQGIERGTTYYYFIRSFDNQDPRNYSSFVMSNEANVVQAFIEPNAVSSSGTLPGYYRFKVVGNGVGTDDFGQQYLFSVPADTDLLVYKQIDEMKTPGFDFVGIILLLMGLLAYVILQKKKERYDIH